MLLARFKYVGKDSNLPESSYPPESEENKENSNLCLSISTKGSNRSIEILENDHSYEIYEEAKGYLYQVSENRKHYDDVGKKMTAEIKLRMAAFKESEIKIHD